MYIIKATRASYKKSVEPFMELIKEMRRKGNTEGNIAEHLGIAQSTWYKYKTLHPELTKVLVEYRDVSKVDITKSPLSMIGFTSTSITRKHIEVDGIIKENTIEVTETVTEYKRNDVIVLE